MNKWTKLGGIFIVMVALVALVGSTLTFAQTDPTPDTNDSAEGFGGPRGHRGDREPLVDKEAMQETLAGALGITVAELEAFHAEGKRLPEIAEELGVDLEAVGEVMQAAFEEAVNQAVEDGTITAEQAERILENGPRGKHGGRGGHGPIDKEAMQTAVSEALGITVEELQAYHDEGLKLPEIVEELGLNMEDVQASLEASREAAINQAVEDGTITQEQADQILSGEGRRGHGRGPGRPHGGQGGPGGFQGGGFGNPNAPTAEQGA